MISISRRLRVLTLITWSTAWSAYRLDGATISGTVKNSTGAPYRGAFVRVRNVKTTMTVSVLSDSEGRYRVPNVPPGDYEVRATGIGYKDDVRSGVTVANSSPSLDFTLQKGKVRWSDLNTYQGRQLLPKTKDHDLSYNDRFFTSCFQSCHSFQKTMTSTPWDENGWRSRVKYMRDVIMAGEGGGTMTDKVVEDFTSYLTFAFGPDSPKPQSPEDLPEYQRLVRSFSDHGIKIVYVEFDFAGSKGLGPWSAVEDKDGMIWSPYYGRGNEVHGSIPTQATSSVFRFHSRKPKAFTL